MIFQVPGRYNAAEIRQLAIGRRLSELLRIWIVKQITASSNFKCNIKKKKKKEFSVTVLNKKIVHIIAETLINKCSIIHQEQFSWTWAYKHLGMSDGKAELWTLFVLPALFVGKKIKFIKSLIWEILIIKESSNLISWQLCPTKHNRPTVSCPLPILDAYVYTNK